MAVGVIADHPFVEPDDALGAKRFAQDALDFLFAEARVAVRVEKALARRDDGPLAVDFDRAALGDERVEAAQARAGSLRDDLRDAIVLGERVFPAPAVEAKRAGGEADSPVIDKDRPRVAQPDIPDGRLVQADERGVRQAEAHRLRRDPRFLPAHQQLNALSAHPLALFVIGVREEDRADQLCDLALRRREIFLPEIGGGRPADPHRLMRRPFGGLAAGRFHGRSCRSVRTARPR